MELCCPVCGQTLAFENRAARCPAGHSFDMAREGYVNLLLGSRSGDKMGDSKAAARSRRDFLNRGYYAPLRDWLCREFSDKRGTLLDLCCGEGYYTSALGENENLRVYGFDLAREMVRLAAKRGKATFFVANMAAIPVSNAAFDYAVELFAPFQEGEFYRILKPGGTLYVVVPGKDHLFGLKQALYDRPYPNDEQLPRTKHLRLTGTEKVTAHITLQSQQDIQSVFQMTPYYFHTSDADRRKLATLQSLSTPIEFVIARYVRPEDSHG